MERKDYTIEEVAELLDIPVSKVQEYLDMGIIKSKAKKRVCFGEGTLMTLTKAIGLHEKGVVYLTSGEIYKKYLLSSSCLYSYEEKGYIKSIRVPLNRTRLYQEDELVALISTDGLLSAYQLRKATGISISYLWRLVKSGYIKPVKILPSGTNYFDPSAIDLVKQSIEFGYLHDIPDYMKEN